MTADPKKAAAVQEERMREFDAAVTGRGPPMTAPEAGGAREAGLGEALRETFAASGAPELSSNETALGAPHGRWSAT